MNRTIGLRVSAVPLLTLWALLNGAGPHGACAATITNYLALSGIYGTSVWRPTWQQARLTINVGDTVVWVNPSNSPGPATLASYGGEWQSPPVDPGDSFLLTFTHAAFYAYGIGLSFISTGDPSSGTLEVKAWTNGPPPITINTPPDGAVPPDWQNPLLVQASVPDPSVIPRIEYYANSNLVGTGLGPSYAIWWTNPPAGQNVLVAKAVDQQGGTASSPPVAILYGTEACFWGVHLLAGGQLEFSWNASLEWRTGVIAANDALLANSGIVATSGGGDTAVFVEQGDARTNGPSRFYGFIFVLR